MFDTNLLARPEVFKLSPYGPGKHADEVKREFGLSRVLKLASNENPLGPSPKAVSAIAEHSKRIHLYPDASGFELKDKIASKRGLTPQQVVLGNGCDELLMLLGQVFLNQGDEVIMGHPSFPVYRTYTSLAGAVPVEIPVTGEGTLDLDAMAEAINPKTKMLFVCSPNNPTGSIVTREQARRFMGRIPENVLVVADQAYAEYVNDPDYGNFLPFVQEGKNVIVLHTFSKVYGLAGLRVGYGLAKAEICRLIERVKLTFNQNAFAQPAAVAALDDKEHVEKSLAVNEAGKKFLTQKFSAMGFSVRPTWGNFLLVDTGKDCRALFHSLLRLGVIVRPGTGWGLDTSLRITVGTPEDNATLVRAIHEAIEHP